ncbi:MAG: lytic transglycosylase domain-containing protein [Alkalilacustris sp.]
MTPPTRPGLRMRLALIIWLALLPGERALADPSAICDRAAERASALTGVPLGVLQAIALTETGRRHQGAFRPWPWTTHAVGEGRWFDSRAAAEAHVRALRADGRRSIDIGCFQINFRWHGEAFASPEAMFDPDANALYAARFLADLREELGSWDAAAGAYHSRTPELAARYTARFRQHLAVTQNAAPPAMQQGRRAGRGTPARDRGGPLLQAAQPLFGTSNPATASLGSLAGGGTPGAALIVSSARALR